MRRRVLPLQGQVELNFFDVPTASASESGALDVAHAVRDVLVDVLSAARVAEQDRFEIASQISRVTNRSMTKDMLDQYCANSADGKRFPLEALPALTLITGDYRLLEFIAESCGCRILRGEEAMVAELGALAMQEKAIKDRLKHINSYLPASVAEKLSAEALKRLGQK